MSDERGTGSGHGEYTPNLGGKNPPRKISFDDFEIQGETPERIEKKNPVIPRIKGLKDDLLGGGKRLSSKIFGSANDGASRREEDSVEEDVYIHTPPADVPYFSDEELSNVSCARTSVASSANGVVEHPHAAIERVLPDDALVEDAEHVALGAPGVERLLREARAVDRERPEAELGVGHRLGRTGTRDADVDLRAGEIHTEVAGLGLHVAFAARLDDQPPDVQQSPDERDLVDRRGLQLPERGLVQRRRRILQVVFEPIDVERRPRHSFDVAVAPDRREQEHGRSPPSAHGCPAFLAFFWARFCCRCALSCR